jgi:hypothetical protein
MPSFLYLLVLMSRTHAGLTGVLRMHAGCMAEHYQVLNT